MKKILTLAAALAMCVAGAKAQVVLQDSFTYPSGFTTNVSGNLWTNYSGSLDSVVNNGRLEVFGTATPPSAVRSGDIFRPFTNTPTSTVLYASFIVNSTNLVSTANYFAHFSANSSTFKGKVFNSGLGVAANTWRLGTAAGGNAGTQVTYPQDLATNVDYEVVIAYDTVNFLATLWIDPVSSSDLSVQSIDSTTAATLGFFSFRQSSPNINCRVDNLFVGNSFADVAGTVVKPPTIYYQPVAGPVTNFVGNTLALSVVAGGAGTVTFQWQHAGTNLVDDANNVGSTSNILKLVSALAPQSGNYACVVTSTTNSVFAGSITSSVEQVVVTANPVPPIFVSQPASTTGYVGQTVVLSTTVNSPGTVTYTWYSNNVVVTDGQADSGQSSTLTISSLVDYVATYKVAVTNSVNVNGVVSTNAVLTYTNAPNVSIAFLRQLQDPVTYAVTVPITQPYQVTGVITTYTNLTTGNTASYYLQDATAGINIFATFGSTFRPAQGAVVTFVGVLSTFSSGLELDADPALPYTSYTDTGVTNSLPAPLVIPFTITNTGYANMNTNIAGRYVQLQNVYFGTNAGTAITNGFYTVTNGSGQSFRLWFSIQDQAVLGQILPTFAPTVTGVMFGSQNAGNPTFAVAVTDFAGIAVAPPASIPLTTTVSGGMITFNWSDPSFTLQTTTNLLGPWVDVVGATTGYTITINSDPTDFYRLVHP